MNGRIRCESTEGVGSNFTIDIPVTIEGLDVQKIPACQVHVLNCPEPISPYLSAVSAFSNVEIVHHDTYEDKGSDNGLYLVFEDMDKQWREAVKNSSRQFIFVSNNMIENRTQPNVFVMESNPFLTSELDVRIRTSLLGSEEKQDSGKAKGKKKEQLLMSGHILIVEDNAYNQELLISQLELLGCKSSVAVNGAQALEILENNAFDIILTDCHMPVMDGFEFIQRLRAMEANDSQLTKHIVIAATANSSIEEKNKCIEYGMDDFISKPISLKNLTRLIKHYLPSNMSSTDIIQLDKNEIVSAGIDPSVLAQYIGDDIAIQKQFLQTFIRLSADIVEQLNIAFDKSDMKTIKQLGHKFKSSLKSVGANALVELCHQLEHQTAIDLSLKVKLNQHYEDLMVAAKSFINQC